MFSSIDLSNQVLDATMLRFNTLSGNVANVETPGYKRQDVAFQQKLQRELEKNDPKARDLNNVKPIVYEDKGAYAQRLDGNNVDIDKEMAELAKTKLRYDTLIQRTTAQIGRYKYILQNIK